MTYPLKELKRDLFSTRQPIPIVNWKRLLKDGEEGGEERGGNKARMGLTDHYDAGMNWHRSKTETDTRSCDLIIRAASMPPTRALLYNPLPPPPPSPLPPPPFFEVERQHVSSPKACGSSAPTLTLPPLSGSHSYTISERFDALAWCTPTVRVVAWLSNVLAMRLWDRSIQRAARAVTLLTQALQIKPSTSPSHRTLTPSQPVPALTL